MGSKRHGKPRIPLVAQGADATRNSQPGAAVEAAKAVVTETGVFRPRTASGEPPAAGRAAEAERDGDEFLFTVQPLVQRRHRTVPRSKGERSATEVR